jgi:hypothetical protein
MRFVPQRRPALPRESTERLGIDPGEKVLAWSELAGGGCVAATRTELAVLTRFGKLIRRQWVEVDHVAWDQDSRTLAVWWVGKAQATGLELPEGSFLPEVAHERWRSSVLLTREVPLPGGRAAWVALRRAPDGGITTQVNLPPQVRRDDPQVQQIVRRAQAQLREEAGVPAEGDLGL